MSKVKKYNQNFDSTISSTKSYKLSEHGYIDHKEYNYIDVVNDSAHFKSCKFEDRFDIHHQFHENYKSEKKYLWQREIVRRQGASIYVSSEDSDKELIDFGSNDYLNLTQHTKVKKAMQDAVELCGAGSSGSTSFSGTLKLHNILAKEIAGFKQCEKASLFTTGFTANYGVLNLLIQKNDLVILDVYVHASIVVGTTGKNRKFFSHNNTDSLERILRRSKGKYANILIVVDGVYSMEGDLAPLDKIVSLAKEYGAYTMVDDAHATGVLGEDGRGSSEHFDVEGKVDFIMGTCSKALGTLGGFIAGSKKSIDYINFLSTSSMFSSTLPPAVVGGTIASLAIIKQEPALRTRLWENIAYFKKGLSALRLDVGNSQSAIIPVTYKNAEQTLKACIFVNPVMYPAVPKKHPKLRFSITAAMEKEHLDKTLNLLGDCDKN
jgi:glycine C-acetyltransferase